MTVTPILSTVFSDIENYHKKLTSYIKFVQFITNSDNEYTAIPLEYDDKKHQLTVKLDDSGLTPIIQEIEVFTIAPKMSRALDVKFYDIANSITDGAKFMQSIDSMMKESQKTTCYVNALNGHTNIIESINAAVNGTTSGAVNFDSPAASLKNCASQYSFNSESNPFDYAVKFYLDLSDTVLQGIEKGVNISNTSTYFQGKEDQYNQDMQLDDYSVLLRAFIGTTKRVVHHTDKQKLSVEGSQDQYKHTLCAKYSLVKSQEFTKDIEKIKDFEFLNALSKEFQDEYKNYQSWTYAANKNGYYDYLSNQSIYSALNAQQAIKNSVMSKLKSSSENDIESKVLDSFENQPEAILSLYQLASKEGPNQPNSLKLFNTISPVYDNYCKPLSDDEEMNAHNPAEFDL